MDFRKLNENNNSEYKIQDMYLIAEDSKKMREYPYMIVRMRKLIWVNEKNSSIKRVPKERNWPHALFLPMIIMGKTYPSLFSKKSPFKNMTHGQEIIDKYGRSIICFKDRFPCFDSADYLMEDRYFYWFFIREGNKLFRLFYQDETEVVFMTKDVAYVEYSCWNYMKKSGFCQKKEDKQ